jgi:hypothetical protein
MRNLLLATAFTAQLSLLVACGEDGSCQPNTEVACECDDGAEGTRYCLSNRSFDDCYCEESEPWSPDEPTPRDAGRPTGFDAGLIDSFFRDAGMDAGPAAVSDGRLLLAGEGKLIDVFTRDKDVWVVVPSRVVRISLDDGSELARWEAPRPLLTAAFDGERLAVLDGAKATLLERSELKVQVSANLVEPCATAVLMLDGPLICSPGFSSSALYVLDPVNGAALSSTRALQSAKLLAIPGTRRLLAIDPASSFSSQVFELSADGGVLVAPDGGSASGSSSGVTWPAAFDAVPAQHLVTRQGVLLRMNGTCSPTSEPCFTRTGTLGLLSGQEAFLALETVGDSLFGLIDSSNSFSAPRCSTQPCRLLDIDVAAREVRVEQAVHRPLRSVVAMHVLEDQKAAVLGVGAVGNEKYYSSSTDAGYEVVRVDLKAKQ